jgi:hypothetical protein
LPLAASHSRTVASSPAEAISVPSGDHAQSSTVPAWPVLAVLAVLARGCAGSG